MKLEEAIRIMDLFVKNIAVENVKVFELKDACKVALQELKHLQEQYDTDTHILQGQLDIANARIIELQKENEELKEHNRKYLEAEIFSAKQIKEIEKQRNEHYIHKDKIREKIENEKTVVETCYGRIKYREGRIASLEDLLKEE